MAIPAVTTGSDVSLNYSAGTQNVALSATATNSPTSFTWTILSVPTGSTALTTTRGNFVNGVATVQNPSFVTDAGTEGTYVVQCVATNSSGDSDPAEDKQSAQQNIVVKTAIFALSLPNDYQYDWADYMNDNLLNLEEVASSGYNATVLGSKGALLTHDGTEEVQLAVGTDDYILTADSSESNGVVWKAFSNIQGNDYLTTDMPTDVTTAPVLLYQFDGTANALTDRSSYSHDLSVISGTEIYTVVGARMGILLESAGPRLQALTSAAVQITGAITIEVYLMQHGINGTVRSIIGHLGASEDEVNNAIWYIDQLATAYPTGGSSGTGFRGIRWFQEYDAGSNSSVAPLPVVLPLHQPTLLTVTRASDGTSLVWYRDGLQLTTSSLSNAPTGGTSGSIWVGNNPDSNESIEAWIACIRVTPVVFTAAQVLEAWNSLRH